MNKSKRSRKFVGAHLKGIPVRRDTTVPLKKENAITLIALVITIILLLILAGVVISNILNNGVLDKSEKAADTYRYEQAREKLILKLTEYKFGVLAKENPDLRQKLNEVDDYKDVKEVQDGKYYLVTIDGFEFLVEKETLKITQLEDRVIEKFPIKEPGTYSMTINANKKAKWLELIKINETIPEGATIEYTFLTSDDMDEWGEWTSIKSINDANVTSQYLMVVVTLKPNDKGISPSIQGLKVRFKVEDEENEEIVAIETMEKDGEEIIEEVENGYKLKEGVTEGIVSQIIQLDQGMNVATIKNNLTCPVITKKTLNDNTIVTDTENMNVTESSRNKIYVGIKNTNTNEIEWIEIEKANTDPNVKYQYVKIETNIKQGEIVSKASIKGEIYDVSIVEPDWVTVQTLYYFSDATSERGEWLNIVKDETLVSGSRIIYSFAKSNNDEDYTEYSSDILDNNPSRYIKIKVEIQVKDEEETEYAKLNNLIINYKLDGEIKSSIPGAYLYIEDTVTFNPSTGIYSVAITPKIEGDNLDAITVQSIQMEGGTEITGTTATYTVSQPGKYKFYIKLSNGKTYEKNVEIFERKTFDVFADVSAKGLTVAQYGFTQQLSNCQRKSFSVRCLGAGKWDGSGAYYGIYKISGDKFAALDIKQIMVGYMLQADGSATITGNVTVYYKDGTYSYAQTGTRTKGKVKQYVQYNCATNLLDKEIDYFQFKIWRN